MKITIESTTQIVQLIGGNGVEIPARLWEGTTDSGIHVQCLVTRIAAKATDDLSQFERELKETMPPTLEWNAFPLRMIL